ncbi:alpha/beta fold hydrolase [Nocardia sp. NPDC052001]|uniref:alpha/beta fold hydrolase n=1 Tax=Nocardia sp. NPDC052001 TaxID=3154853 RepID=UPI0034200F72
MTDLYTREWGAGDRLALLVHGITTDSTTWLRLGPELAERGYHVIAPDLPGHGKSARAAGYSVESLARALADSVPHPPELAIGHSLGGLLLATAVEEIKPERVIYIDPAWGPGHPSIAEAFRAQKYWTLDDVRSAAPRFTPEAHVNKLESLALWDETTLEIIPALTGFTPAPPSARTLLLLADPSTVVTPDQAVELTAKGFHVHTVPGAGHVIHHDDYPAFLNAAREWL